MKIFFEKIGKEDEIWAQFDWAHSPQAGDVVTLSGVSYKVKYRKFVPRDGEYVLVARVSDHSEVEI